MENVAAPSPFHSLPVVIRALRGALGGWGVRGLLSTVLVLLVHRRLGEICGRMERLAARFEAGRLWRIVRTEGAGRGVACARGRTALVRIWPWRFGWLVRVAGYQAAGYGSQLRAVLAHDEMVALLEASPQAVRILRPLCRMLAIETSVLRPGVVTAAPAVRAKEGPAQTAKRVRKRRAPVDWGRIPLPRGVLAAARRQGFGKIPKP